MKTAAILVLCLAAFALGGCNYLAYLFYLGAPDTSDKTEEAEFKDLPNKTVAVLVYADQKVLYDHNYLREQVSSVVGFQLTKNVSNLKTVTPERITRFQDENMDWASMGKAALGKKFGADYVLYVSLMDFSTLEPGSTYLHRGHLSAQVTLHKCSLPEAQACVWNGGDITIAYPEDESVGQLMEDDRQLRNDTIRTFAELLAKKFYKHKIEDKKEDKK